jgi:hypothetical protein
MALCNFVCQKLNVLFLKVFGEYSGLEWSFTVCTLFIVIIVIKTVGIFTEGTHRRAKDDNTKLYFNQMGFGNME